MSVHRMDLDTLETARIINAPCPAVWDLLTDTTRWPRWGPSVQQVHCSDRHIRQGSRGRVRTALGFWLSFEITSLKEGRSWTWRVAGIQATGHRVEPLFDGRCRLIFEVPLPAAPYLLICMLGAKRIARLLEH